MKTEREHEEVDDVERCRQVRRSLEAKCGGLNGLFEHFAELDRRHPRRQAKKQGARKPKRTSKKAG